MVITLHTISVSIIFIHVISVILNQGLIFNILTKYDMGVYSENPLFWAIFISLGGLPVFLWYKVIYIDLILLNSNIKSTTIHSWKLPKIQNNNVQECYTRTLSDIWNSHDGIQTSIRKNWLKLL